MVPNSQTLNQPPQLPNHALPTPVQINKLRLLLCGYDSALTSISSDGCTFGFPLHFRGDRISFFANDLISAQKNAEIVSAKISKELAADDWLDLSINHHFLIFLLLLLLLLLLLFKHIYTR